MLVSVAPELGDVLAAFLPDVLVDARMRKRAQPEPQRGLAPLTIGLGPSFVAGETTDLAIETQWGDALGAVVTQGPTQPLGGEPRAFDGHARDRFVYAPVAGVHAHAGGDRAGASRRGRRSRRSATSRCTHRWTGSCAGSSTTACRSPRARRCSRSTRAGSVSKVFGIGPRPRRIAEGVLEAMLAPRAR